MFTKEMLENLICKLPPNDTFSYLIKDAAVMFNMLEEASDDASRDIFNDKVSLTIGDNTVSIPLYITDVVNCVYTMVESVIQFAVDEVNFEPLEMHNEKVRCNVEKMLMNNIIRNHEVMSDEEFQEAFETTRSIYHSRLLEAMANDDKSAINFYETYDNRYDYLHQTAEGGMLYKMFLEMVDVNKFPTPAKAPISILDIEPVGRAFYQDFINRFLQQHVYYDALHVYTERIAITESGL